MELKLKWCFGMFVFSGVGFKVLILMCGSWLLMVVMVNGGGGSIEGVFGY